MIYMPNSKMTRLNNLLAQHINEFKESGHDPVHNCFSDLIKVYKFVESCLKDGIPCIPNETYRNYVGMSQGEKEKITGLQPTDYEDSQEHIISLVDAILLDKEGFSLHSFRRLLIDNFFQHSKEYVDASDRMTFRLSDKDLAQSKLGLEGNVKDAISVQLDG